MKKMRSNMRIAVVGAGIAGTSSAYLIKQKYPQADVTIYADRITDETTSYGAAGIVKATNIGETKREDVIRWCKATIDYARDLLENDPDASLKGISLIHGYCVSRKEECPEIDWKHLISDYKLLTQSDLKHFPKFVKSGYALTTVTIECSKYIPFITAEFQRNGGRIIKQKINSLNELFHFDIIVNCSGLGAKELCNDQEMLPIRGQLVRVHAPWMKHFIMSMEAESDGHWGYIIPNQDTVVLGGTLYRNNDSYTISQDDQKWIIQNATSFVPSLQNAKIVREWVGLRPFRKTVRLEHEKMVLKSQTGDMKEKVVDVLHNYGHGGHGVASFMGCAQTVLKMVENCLMAKPKL